MWKMLQCIGIMLLIFITVLFMVTVNGFRGSNQNRSEAMVNDLRRQLMRDNYDYIVEDDKHSTKEFVVDKKLRRNFYVPKVIEERNSFSKIDKDLFDAKVYEKQNEEKTESTAKYEFLKVKHKYRRNNHAHVIQEENKDGVAIINVNSGPFPELRLPETRRQFMHDRGELIPEEEDVPPPPVNTSDPEAAVDVRDVETEV